jgi:Na+/melibiose symporter-like transporter
MSGQRLPRDYWLLWSASTASNLGDGLRLVALPLFATTLTADPVLIAGITALTYLPWLVIGPFSGAIVDRVDKRTLMVGVQLARGAVAAVFALAVVTELASIWVLYAATIAIAVGETFADSAAQASVPRLVGGQQLEAANSRLVSAQLVTNEIAGAPLGAALFALAAAAPFAVDASTYLLAGVLLLAIQTDLRPAPLEPGRDPGRIHDEVAEGLRFVFRHEVLRPTTIAAALANLGAGAAGGILVLFVVEWLGLPEFAFGVLLGVGAVGGVLGATASSRLVDRLGRRTTLLATAALTAIATATLGVAVGPVTAGVSLAIMFGASAALNVVSQSVRQAVAPARILGRVITSVRLVGLGAVPVGAMLGGVVARLADLRAPFLFAALTTAGAYVVLARGVTQEAIDESIGQTQPGERA